MSGIWTWLVPSKVSIGVRVVSGKAWVFLAAAGAGVEGRTISLAVRNDELLLDTIDWSVMGVILPFSSDWKIWLAARTRRGKRDVRLCACVRGRGGGRGGSGSSLFTDADAKFSLASSTNPIITEVVK